MSTSHGYLRPNPVYTHGRAHTERDTHTHTHTHTEDFYVNIFKWVNLYIVTLTLTLWLINSGVLTSLLLPHLSSSLTDSLPSLNLLCHSKTDARFMQDALKAVWSIPYVSVAFFPGLKQNLLDLVLLKCQIAFLKFTSCDNQALVLVGCIPIAAAAVHLKLKS